MLKQGTFVGRQVTTQTPPQYSGLDVPGLDIDAALAGSRRQGQAIGRGTLVGRSTGHFDIGM